MTNPTFGWVIQPASRDSAGTGTLMEDNYRFIERVQGDFTTIWVEDHFQWDDRPVVECWTALSMLAAKYTELTFGPLVLGPSMLNLSQVIRSVA
jgi:alkanesulfonate monooxygenase SsuD/methylene tetrahydromethanopterin reductase-like flavin-dependent oxidoreductase (luciferase family)